MSGEVPIARQLWEDLVLQRNARTEKIGMASLTATVSPQQHAVIFAAAEARDLNLSCFARRAAVSFAAFDLGIAWEDIISDEDKSWRFAQFRNRREHYGPHDFGPWEITGLR